MSRTLSPAFKSSWRYWFLVVFLFLIFLTGGASRVDVQSLFILRPVSVLACAVALMTLRWEHFTNRTWLMAGFGLLFALAITHIIPLPPSIWQALPGREDLIEVEKLAGFSGVWRPLTLAPMNGWHAVSSLFTPLAILLLGVQLGRDDLFRLLPALITLCTLSGFFGMLQVIGSEQSPLYFYNITNNGSAVGFFANRNHAAALLACMFPMLAVFASALPGKVDQQKRRQIISVVIAITLVPLILVTGSRSGLLLAIIGLAGGVLVYQRQPASAPTAKGLAKWKSAAGPILCLAVAMGIGLATIYFSRAEAIERFFAKTSSEDNRIDFWLKSADLFWKYFPFGSGSGSFVEAFQIIEPTAYLDSTYLNHAHNDWIETAVTYGLPGLLVLAVAVFFFVRRIVAMWRRNNRKHQPIIFARMASIAIAILALSSFTDYPLRTPTMMAVFMLFSLWLIEAGRGTSVPAGTTSGSF